jgi:hypothetical protein
VGIRAGHFGCVIASLAGFTGGWFSTSVFPAESLSAVAPLILLPLRSEERLCQFTDDGLLPST